MWQRLKNLWALSKYRVDEPLEFRSHGIVRGAPELVNVAKPKKKLATIVQDNPLDVFPEEKS